MIPLVPTATHTAAPFAGFNLSAFIRDMVDAWIAHHQRMSDLGINAEF